jgi:hypothetical protein
MLSQIKLVIITIIIIIVIILAALFYDKVVPKENSLHYGYGILALVVLIGIFYTGFNHFNNVRKGASVLFSKPKPVKQANTLNTYIY